ncbi:hypothetical protein MRX96_011257 [Rhipicephalus microplus]
MPPVAPTTTINFKRLIELVRPYPYLYNRQEPKFKDVALKNQRWNMIGAEFGITGKLLPKFCPQQGTKFYVCYWDKQHAFEE